MYIPLSFFLSAKPRNLKFRIANTLTIRLLSLFTVNLNFPPRYFVLLSNSLSDAFFLFANNTISSAYLIQGTPPFVNFWSNSLRYTSASNIDNDIFISLLLIYLKCYLPCIVHREPYHSSRCWRSIPFVLILKFHRADCSCLRFHATFVSFSEIHFFRDH